MQQAKWIMSEQLSKLLGRRGQRRWICEMDFTIKAVSQQIMR